MTGYKRFLNRKFLFFFFIFIIIPLLEIFLYQSNLINFPQRSIFFFFLIQIDLLLLLLLLYFIFRYLWRIFWEIRGKKISRSLKFKLFLLYFLSITFPAVILVLGSFYFLKKGMDYWFEEFSSEKIIARLLQKEDFIKDVEAELLQKAFKIKEEYLEKTDEIKSKDLREKFRYFLGLNSIEIFYLDGNLFKKTYSSEIDEKLGIPPSLLEKIIKEKTPQTFLQPIDSRLILRIFLLFNDKKGQPYILAVGKILNPQMLSGKIDEKGLTQSLNLFLFLSFLLLFLFILFVGIWVGNKLGKSLSEPLQGLILATQRISQRDFDLSELPEVSSQDDEIGRLIQSFKLMAEEIKSYQETLRKYNQYLGGVLNALPVGIVIFKSNRDILFKNFSFQKCLDTSGIKDLKEFADFLSLESYFQTLDFNQTFYKVFTLEREGTELSIGITFMKLELFGDNLLLLIVENLQEKETLKRLSLWREVAVKIAHEIKNPLTPIKLSVERLRKRLSEKLQPEDRDLLNQTVEVVERYVEELRKLALDFYHFSQKPLFEKIEFDLLNNLEEVIELYKLAYPELEINLKKVEVIPSPFLIKADPFQLKRIWINLFDNAIKAMPEKGKINIFLEKKENKIVINFQDNGSGLDEEIASAFNKGDFSKLQKAGTGLLLIKGLVELHQGKIRVENLKEGGTRFILELPC